MHVRRGSSGSLSQDGVVVEEHARGAVCNPGRSAGCMVGNVAYPIDRPSNGGLVANRMRGRIDHHISQDANVVHAAIDLEGIVVKVRHVIVVVINRNRTSVPVFPGWVVGTVDGMRAVRISVSFYVDPVVEISDIIVRNDVTRSVKPDRCVRGKDGREFLTVDPSELCPEVSDPSKEMIRIVPAYEIAVGDVEIARTRIVREDTKVDILKPAFLYR